MSLTDEGHYGPKQLNMLKVIWGEGYLSPGGSEEIFVKVPRRRFISAQSSIQRVAVRVENLIFAHAFGAQCWAITSMSYTLT